MKFMLVMGTKLKNSTKITEKLQKFKEGRKGTQNNKMAVARYTIRIYDAHNKRPVGPQHGTLR